MLSTIDMMVALFNSNFVAAADVMHTDDCNLHGQQCVFYVEYFVLWTVEALALPFAAWLCIFSHLIVYSDHIDFPPVHCQKLHMLKTV